jgi:hypothetical protein
MFAGTLAFARGWAFVGVLAVWAPAVISATPPSALVGSDSDHTCELLSLSAGNVEGRANAVLDRRRTGRQHRQGPQP